MLSSSGPIPSASQASSGQSSQNTFPTTPPSSTACPGLPSLSSIFQASITTFQHVPKGARDSWAKVFSDCLVSVIEDPVNVTL